MKDLLIVLAVVVLLGGGWYFATQYPKDVPEDEVETPSATYMNATADDIVVTAPTPGSTIPRSLAVSGTARGPWYFEASFPITVTTDADVVLLETYMEAQSDWMTTEFVPFSRSITIPGDYTGPAKLILRKDNPSGEAERDASVSIPVTIQ